jgi:hypothetical protein
MSSAPGKSGGDAAVDDGDVHPWTRPLADATRRIQEIVDAAERLAVEIREQAEADAASYAAERRLEADRAFESRTRELRSATAEALGHVESARVQLDELSRSLTAVAARIQSRDRRESRESPLPELTGLPGGEAASPSGTSAHAVTATEEAALRAAQLAVAGRVRSEIEAVLRTEYGLADARAITQEIFGANG